MEDITQNNKRIAKNTLLLYFRMLFIMIVSLFTSRVILRTLGVEDFGIYNVVGGVVAMMGMLNSSMSSSTIRYLTYELGTGNKERLSQIFCMCLQIFMLIAIVFVLFAETIGLWFLNTQLVIPEERMIAANFVYQFSIVGVVNQLLVNPFNATIISHERMNIYAYMSIFEVILKLLIVYLLLIISYDRLIMYGLFFMILSLIITMVYRIYCIKNFEECRFHINKDKTLFKQLVSYSGWNLFGSVAYFVKGQGLNVLINMFFCPSVNAARGIAYQINNAVNQFVSNFYTAVKPQITKYYAQGDKKNMEILVFRSSRLSFFLILFLSLPIIVETPQIVYLWLGELPQYVVPFVRLIIIISAVEGIATPLMTVAHATGRIAVYQSLVGTTTMLIIPISYLFLKLGYSPISVFVISLTIAIICLFERLWILKRLTNFPFIEYCQKVFGNALFITFLSAILPLLLHYYLEESILNLFISIIFCIVNTIMIIIFFGMNGAERKFIISFFKHKI